MQPDDGLGFGEVLKLDDAQGIAGDAQGLAGGAGVVAVDA